MVQVALLGAHLSVVENGDTTRAKIYCLSNLIFREIGLNSIIN